MERHRREPGGHLGDTLPLLTEIIGSYPVTNGSLTHGPVPVTSGWMLAAQSPTESTVATFDPSTWAWSGNLSARIETNDFLRLTLTGQLIDNPRFSVSIGGQGPFDGARTLQPNLL